MIHENYIGRITLSVQCIFLEYFGVSNLFVCDIPKSIVGFITAKVRAPQCEVLTYEKRAPIPYI